MNILDRLGLFLANERMQNIDLLDLLNTLVKIDLNDADTIETVIVDDIIVNHSLLYEAFWNMFEYESIGSDDEEDCLVVQCIHTDVYYMFTYPNRIYDTLSYEIGNWTRVMPHEKTITVYTPY